jgi:hypothetical protein
MSGRARERRERRESGEQRGLWYLLTGLILGLAFGLLFSLRLSPVEYVDTVPDVLRAADKDQYRILVALAYQANGDLGRANQRLAQLHDANPEAALAELAQNLVAEGGDIETARAVAQLASALVQSASTPTTSLQTDTLATATSPAQISGTPFTTLDNEQAIQTATPQPSATLPATPQATFAARITITPTLSTPFVLKDRLPVCDPAVEDGLIQVQVQDATGNPLPGIRVTVTWQAGEETFYSGLTPQIGLGYADYLMSEGYTYLVTIGEGSEQASNLTTGQCTAADGTTHLSGWKLTFALP